MGSYAVFILGSYLFTALVVGGLVARAVLDHRAQERILADLEARGQVRRSARPEAAGLRQRAEAP